MAGWNDPDEWAQLLTEQACPICAGPPDPASVVVREFPHSVLHSTPEAPLFGYCCLVARTHAIELHDLPPADAAGLWSEARQVSQALVQATGCIKLNYEVHGNTIPHFHLHLFPRYRGDPFEDGPIVTSEADSYPYAAGEHARFVIKLQNLLRERAP